MRTDPDQPDPGGREVPTDTGDDDTWTTDDLAEKIGVSNKMYRMETGRPISRGKECYQWY